MKKIIALGALGFILMACQQTEKKSPESSEEVEHEVLEEQIVLKLNTDTSIAFNVVIPETGRYQLIFYGNGQEGNALWLEDYIDNKDDRTYNVTGSITLNESGEGSIDGSPLAEGNHPMKLHLDSSIHIDSIVFDLMIAQKETPKMLTQNMDGDEWSLVWSDEFEGEGLPDEGKWSYNVGNWGWGNNELQYYTEERTRNARQENGNLIIEAHKNDHGKEWTSARLTTQGKVAFTYGKIEFRAKVPVKRGVWAAGWLLGDAYNDEISWPYCGEIDVLECVGYEIDDETGSGLNHATCHTRAYYFKQGNQIGSEIAIDSMNTKFHTYAIEWYPNEIRGYLDGEHYYTYDKNANEQEWPFNNSQNIIVNLAIGGGWGGKKGIEESFESQQYIIDYIRVYEKK